MISMRMQTYKVRKNMCVFAYRPLNLMSEAADQHKNIVFPPVFFHMKYILITKFDFSENVDPQRMWFLFSV